MVDIPGSIGYDWFMDNNTNTRTVELDLAVDHHDQAVAFGQEHGCTVELVTEHGPAAGWPVYALTGTEAAVAALLEAYYED